MLNFIPSLPHQIKVKKKQGIKQKICASGLELFKGFKELFLSQE